MCKISEMYRRTGGTNYRHECGDCIACVGEKVKICKLHGGEVPWNPKWTACAGFMEQEECLEGQITMFDV